MSRGRGQGASGLLRRIFPEAPDLLSMLSEQCEILVEAHAALARQMSKEGSEDEIEFMDAIRRGAEAHRRTLDRLNRAFVTLGDGIGALRNGFAGLGDQVLDTEAEAQVALASERRMEELYRAALSDLFRRREPAEESSGSDLDRSSADCFDAVVDILKRREVYRHLSNAADRVASAAEALHSIVVKWT